MTPADALVEIQGCARLNYIRFSTHARQRMRERNVTYREVLFVIQKCTKIEDSAGCWCIWGPSGSGDDLKIVLVLQNGILVVTILEG